MSINISRISIEGTEEKEKAVDVDHRHQKNGDDDGRVPGGRKRLPAWKTEKQERTERIMSWEFEDLFNNKRTGDGGFLEEPCFIPVGSMGYRRRTTVSGPRIDAEVFPVFGRQMRGALRRARTGNGTVDAQKKANAERSRIRLIQLVEANFTEQDLSIGLDYDGKTPTPERIDKDLTNFFAKVRRRRRARGLPELKYILTIRRNLPTFLFPLAFLIVTVFAQQFQVVPV